VTFDINNYYATKTTSPIILPAIKSNCKTGLSKEGKRAGKGCGYCLYGLEGYLQQRTSRVSPWLFCLTTADVHQYIPQRWTFLLQASKNRLLLATSFSCTPRYLNIISLSETEDSLKGAYIFRLAATQKLWIA